jgi:hypothetical protein
MNTIKWIHGYAFPLCFQTIARQLAEILLRGMCEQSYWNPLEDPPCQSPLDDPLRKGANTKTYTLPRRARVYSGEKYGSSSPLLGLRGGKEMWGGSRVSRSRGADSSKRKSDE